MHDAETLACIRDPNSGDNVSVRVWYVHDLPFSEVQVVGVFRLDDDSEIDFPSLALTEQDKINKMCEQETKTT